MKTDKFQAILAVSLILMLAVIVFLLFTKEIPETNKTLLIFIATTLLAKLGTIYDYHFGSSKGSADKGDILKKEMDIFK
jgi:hypothetical protein